MLTLSNGITLGFDQVVDTLDEALVVIEKIHTAASDGLGFGDLGTAIEIAPKINHIRNDVPEFIAQFEDLSPEESAQVATELVARRGGDPDTIVQKALEALTLASRWHNTGAEVFALIQDTVEFGKNLFRKAA